MFWIFVLFSKWYDCMHEHILCVYEEMLDCKKQDVSNFGLQIVSKWLKMNLNYNTYEIEYWNRGEKTISRK